MFYHYRAVQNDLNQTDTQHTPISAVDIRDTIIAIHWQKIMPWLSTPEGDEILINPDGRIWLDQQGSCHLLPITLDKTQIMGSIRAIAARQAVDIQHQNRMESSYAGLRITAAWPPFSTQGPCLCLRKKSTVEDMSLAWDSPPVSNKPLIDTPASTSLKSWLQQSCTVPRASLVIGPTSTGKTSLIQWLLQQCPTDRIVILEDTPELSGHATGHHLSFACPASEWDTALPFPLRCRPDRIVVGEVRGQEAWTLLNIYLSGHASGWTSVHAHTALTGLTRLAQLIRLHPAARMLKTEDIATLITHSFAYIIQCARIGDWRGPLCIHAIDGYTPKTGYQLRCLYTAQTRTAHI